MFRGYILNKRQNVCEWCGKGVNALHLAHILPKGKYPRLRYCEDNVILLCYYCHMIRWHKMPWEATEFLTLKKGKNYIANLKVIERCLPKQTNHQLEITYFYYKKFLDK